ETIDHRPARQHLQLGIKRGSNRKPALVEFLFAVLLIKIATHFLGEIFGRENVSAGRANGDLQRILLGFFSLGGGDVAVLRHAIDYIIAAAHGGVVPAEWVVVVRPLRQSGKISGFGNRQLVHRFVEIQQRRRRYAISTVAEINFVEIEFENLLLRIGAFDAQRQQRFFDLTLERHLIGKKEILRDLLSNGGGALRAAAASVIFDVQHAGAGDAVYVDAGMLIEILVLGRDESIDDKFRDRLNRQIEPPFLGIFREQRAIAGVDARHHRRFVILKLRIIRQVLGKMPQQARGPGDADDEENGTDRKQEAEKAQEQFHRGTNLIRSIQLSQTHQQPRGPVSRLAAGNHNNMEF